MIRQRSSRSCHILVFILLVNCKTATPSLASSYHTHTDANAHTEIRRIRARSRLEAFPFCPRGLLHQSSHSTTRLPVPSTSGPAIHATSCRSRGGRRYTPTPAVHVAVHSSPINHAARYSAMTKCMMLCAGLRHNHRKRTCGARQAS